MHFFSNNAHDVIKHCDDMNGAQLPQDRTAVVMLVVHTAITKRPTNTMEQSSVEADSRSACHEICLLWKQNFHYRIHNSPLLDLILRHINPV
jgi:hypothetical protein